MPEVGGVGNRGVAPQNQNQPAGRAGEAAGQGQPVGPHGPLGQPTGIPVPGQAQALPDVLAGRDPSQMLAAQQIRDAGGISATDQLLGLHLQPTILGAFAPPPGNSEALRHMTPTMRRTIMRGLLDKQRARMRRLALLLQQDGRGQQGQSDGEDGFDPFAETPAPPDEASAARARSELMHTARLLDLLDHLLAMQDYTISQMGTFSQG